MLNLMVMLLDVSLCTVIPSVYSNGEMILLYVTLVVLPVICTYLYSIDVHYCERHHLEGILSA